MSLNPRQLAFADEYIITGNATQSAIKAGYSEKYANTNASKLLQNTTIKSYIEQKIKEIQVNKHLSMEEALAITASIAKGEPQRFEVIKRDPFTNEVIERDISEYSAGFKERNQALEHYYKINAAFVDKQKVEVTEVPTFIDDIGSEDDG
ncbi:terminase small subunit [Enterococcus casseliflavus]|uniref:Terminase small subunit n=1 Tax=Enterococcus casseliflavus TaxID=37734 RepID=A0ABD5FKK6_ENTCA|nr:terminase small subunit [Enterococcus casseliflavus]MDT2982734.1 terminase small subunit [Enterococcus casseliflavus]